MAAYEVGDGRPDGVNMGQSASEKIAFHGVDTVAQQTVTGARDDGTALASLLTALEAVGLIVDSSTSS